VDFSIENVNKCLARSGELHALLSVSRECSSDKHPRSRTVDSRLDIHHHSRYLFRMTTICRLYRGSSRQNSQSLFHDSWLLGPQLKRTPCCDCQLST